MEEGKRKERKTIKKDKIEDWKMEEKHKKQGSKGGIEGRKERGRKMVKKEREGSGKTRMNEMNSVETIMWYLLWSFEN